MTSRIVREFSTVLLFDKKKKKNYQNFKQTFKKTDSSEMIRLQFSDLFTVNCAAP